MHFSCFYSSYSGAVLRHLGSLPKPLHASNVMSNIARGSQLRMRDLA